MSERKVLNKYYPPEFDPSKIPRGKRNKNATFNIRIMAPFNMRCNMCKDYIYKGKKFNSRKEDVTDEDYLGLRIFRFYIKCPRCVSEIAFKTDLVNTDYTLEAGATRLFEAEKIAHQMAEQERKEREEDELNPMKVLENRTKASQQEMEQIDSLEELREINSRKNTVNTDEMIEKYRKYEELLQQLQMEQEENEIKEIFGAGGTMVVKRLDDSVSDDDEPAAKKPALAVGDKPTDILAEDSKPVTSNKTVASWEKSVGGLSTQGRLKGLVVKKKPAGLPPSASASLVKPKGDLSKDNSASSRSVNNAESESLVKQNGNSDISSHEISDKGVNKPTSAVCQDAGKDDSSKKVDVISGLDIGKDSPMSEVKQQNSTTVSQSAVAPQGLGGLGMLGAYSDSESDSSG